MNADHGTKISVGKSQQTNGTFTTYKKESIEVMNDCSNEGLYISTLVLIFN